MALPLLVAVTAGLAWLLAVGAAQVRAVDAARETARAVARGDPVPEAVALGRRVAPEGATVSVSDGGGRVTVVVTGPVPGPGAVLAGLAGVSVHAEAVAAVEDTS